MFQLLSQFFFSSSYSFAALSWCCNKTLPWPIEQQRHSDDAHLMTTEHLRPIRKEESAAMKCLPMTCPVLPRVTHPKACSGASGARMFLKLWTDCWEDKVTSELGPDAAVGLDFCQLPLLLVFHSPSEQWHLISENSLLVCLTLFGSTSCCTR